MHGPSSGGVVARPPPPPAMNAQAFGLNIHLVQRRNEQFRLNHVWYALNVKPHPRIRKTVKWAGAAASVLLLAVWIGSGWCWWRGVRWPTVNVGVSQGQLVITRFERPSGLLFEVSALIQHNPPRSLGINSFNINLRYVDVDFRGLFRVFGFPLWIPASLAMFVTAAAFRLDSLARRRAHLNLCPTCHYDRAGLPANAPCPECAAPCPPSPS